MLNMVGVIRLAYKIRYDDTLVKEVIKKSKKGKINLIRKPLIWLFATILAFVMLYNQETLRSYILPGNPDVTEAALQSFVNDIREGESLSGAITAFCQEIISHANIPQ